MSLRVVERSVSWSISHNSWRAGPAISAASEAGDGHSPLMSQPCLQFVQQTFGVRTTEPPRVSLEGHSHWIGFDQRTAHTGVHRGQPDGDAAQVRHHDAVDTL